MNPSHWTRLGLPSLLIGPLMLVGGLLSMPTGPSPPPDDTANPSRESGDERQVTVFGIVAVPGRSGIDPALADVSPQLRKLMPEHGFRLLGAANERVHRGQAVACDLRSDRVLRVNLLEPMNLEGKVRLHVRLSSVKDETTFFEADVATPPNQLLFLQKELEHASDGASLLIGIGAR